MALQLVEGYTSIPAPLWIDDYEESGDTILIMTQVEGQTLSSVLHRLSYQEREQLSKDLKITVQQLRRVPNRTPYRFANTLGGALVDHRAGKSGPFNEESDFNSHLTYNRYVGNNLRAAVAPVHSRQHQSFFTHGDLHSANVLMSQGRLAGIVDWECAGYFPEYWEFTKALYCIFGDKRLEKIVRDAFDEDYEDELRAERTLWRAAPYGL